MNIQYSRKTIIVILPATRFYTTMRPFMPEIGEMAQIL